MVTVGVVAGLGNERAHELAGRIVDRLEETGTTVRVDEKTASAIGRSGVAVSDLSSCDLVVTLGGDGTLLFAVRETGGVPVVGVNLGEVGFVNAVDPDEAETVVTDLVATIDRTGSVPGTDRLRVRVTGDDWFLEPALNEVVVFGPGRGPGAGGSFTVAVDGERYLAGEGDGILVATPTGSSAYNLAEGGPLILPAVDAILVTPMAVDADRPPLVVDASATVQIEVEADGPVHVVADGRNRRQLESPASVTVSADAPPVRFADPQPAVLDRLDTLTPKA